jgi:hypothetical protein
MSTPHRSAIVAAAALAIASGAFVLAQDEPKQQQQGGPTAVARKDKDAAGAATRPWKLRRGNPALLDAPTDEEWKAVVDLMAEYSPNRLKAIEEQASQDGPRYESLRKMVFMHYRDLALARERGDHELYDLKLQLVKKDDDVWATQRQMREAPEPDRPVLHYRLKQKVAELVRLGLKERELRIQRLEKALAEEKARLAADEAQVDQRINDRVRSMTAGLRSPRRIPETGGNATGGAGATTSQVR